MEEFDEIRKTYSKTKKHRCVFEEHFDPEGKMRKMYERHFKPVGVDWLVFKTYWLKVTGEYLSNPIVDSVNWVFENKDEYNPGRFNTSKFPALYTAKEIETAISEKQHYLPVGHKREIQFVVFSVYFSGILVDIRQAERDGTFVIAEAHEACQEIGDRIWRRGYDGIAAPSLRKFNGNCCAIYNRRTVRSGDVVERGAF